MSREQNEHEPLSTAELVGGAERARTDAHREQEGTTEPQPMQAMAEQMVDRRDDRQAVPVDTRQAPQQAMPSPGQAMPAGAHEAEQLAALFPTDVAADFRHRWDSVQIGFVDDPRQAVQKADELVADVMKTLASSFADQRSRLEKGLTQGNQANTEDLRMALHAYRSFFQRLLSL
jgi:hypothetical protein